MEHCLRLAAGVAEVKEDDADDDEDADDDNDSVVYDGADGVEVKVDVSVVAIDVMMWGCKNLRQKFKGRLCSKRRAKEPTTTRNNSSMTH